MPLSRPMTPPTSRLASPNSSVSAMVVLTIMCERATVSRRLRRLRSSKHDGSERGREVGIDCGVTTSCNVDCLDCMFVLTWWSGPKKFTDCFVSVGSLTSSSTALASPMTPMGFFVFLCWSRRRLSGALELELRTGGDTTKGGERETHQWAGALRLTPICEAEKARRPSPRS